VTSATGEPSDCIFCDASKPGPGHVSNTDLVLFRGRTCYVILNLFPYNNGHLMVVPKRHIGSLSATTSEEREELMDLTRHAEIALTEAYTPQGINMGINLGRPAGAGILDHLHIHAVPRWNGDTNFMTVLSDTRVLPESLEATKKRLQPIFERLELETKRSRNQEARNPEG